MVSGGLQKRIAPFLKNSPTSAIFFVFKKNLLCFHSECYREAQPSISDEGPTCTFTEVYPDGEVHWFQGPNNVTGDPKIKTKQVKDGKFLTITSSLNRKTVSGEGAYNCSLWIPSTGAYLTSSLVPEHGEARVEGPNANGAGAIGSVWKTFLVLLSTLFLV